MCVIYSIYSIHDILWYFWADMKKPAWNLCLESVNHYRGVVFLFFNQSTRAQVIFFTFRCINVTKRRRKGNTRIAPNRYGNKAYRDKDSREEGSMVPYLDTCTKECRSDTRERKGRRGNEKRTKRIRATTRCDFTRDRESTKDEKKLGSL